MILRLSAKAPLVIKWCIEGSFSNHKEMKSFTESIMSMGTGSILSNAIKHKLNTHSSTDSELVAMDDMMSQVLWK
jgi:hypothetical protein